jgi:hypothetical protein
MPPAKGALVLILSAPSRTWITVCKHLEDGIDKVVAAVPAAGHRLQLRLRGVLQLDVEPDMIFKA